MNKYLALNLRGNTDEAKIQKNMSWKKFIEIIQLNRFEVGLYDFVVSEGKEEEILIFTNREKGIVIRAQSLNVENVYSAVLLGEIRPKCGKITEENLNSLVHANYMIDDTTKILFEINIEYDFLAELEKISKYFYFISDSKCYLDFLTQKEKIEERRSLETELL